MKFQSQIRIHFDEADPAGIAFFGGIYPKIHRCYEEFLSSMGVDLKEWFLNPEVITPIRHQETEFFAPLLPFEDYQVETHVLRISESSFQLQFEIKQTEKKHCIVKTTHVCCHKKTMEKTRIPEKLVEQLNKYILA